MLLTDFMLGDTSPPVLDHTVMFAYSAPVLYRTETAGQSAVGQFVTDLFEIQQTLIIS